MPPVGKAEEALRRQKEARQKKLLLVLVPVFLVLVFWQGPGMLKAFSGGSEPAEETSPAESAATTPDPAASAPPSTGSGTDPVSPPGPATLPESAAPTAGPGQLVTFDRFVGKDPFRQQVEAEDESADSGGSASSSGTDDSAGGADSGGGSADDGQDSGSGGSSGTTPTASDDDGGESDGGGEDGVAAPTSATIEVNGTQEEVSVDAPFPSFDPIFRLVSLTRRSAKIGLVSGEFSNGAATVTLTRGRPLTLVSEPDGLRYVITLVRVG